MYRRYFKRAFDLIVSVMLLLLLSPLLLTVALLLYVFNNGQILFLQQRSGCAGKPFTLIKFKTMRDDPAQAAPGGEQELARITPLGKVLRTTSLDELPQLFNVLRGDMSLVGPRPLLTEYLPLYSPQQRRRLEVLPGLTGLAQTEGRNSLTWEEKFAADVRYVDSVSAWLDLKILVLTALRVFAMSGITPGKEVMMERFRGTPPR